VKKRVSEANHRPFQRRHDDQNSGALTDALGNLVRFVLPGHRFDTAGVAPLIEGLAFDGFIADKAFDSNSIIADLNARGAKMSSHGTHGVRRPCRSTPIFTIDVTLSRISSAGSRNSNASPCTQIKLIRVSPRHGGRMRLSERIEHRHAMPACEPTMPSFAQDCVNGPSSDGGLATVACCCSQRGHVDQSQD
jgi:hypothetical protein